ncbi:MAG: hypothetical protein OET90_00820 [Desulfuromonadales bacterium]|nr:hypothetical protein [Desulfuromonadales bacterium]
MRETTQDFIFEDDLAADNADHSSQNDAQRDDSASLLPRILRMLGAGIIFSCASIFLFQRWGGGNDVQRYLLLLAFTSVLTAGGFFCGLKLQESKGARTLLGLTLAVTPVNFAVLGGLVYSQFAIGWGGANVPSFASWVAPSPAAALTVAVFGAVALAGLCYISFLTMGRKQVKSLTACFFLSNLALLIPTRHPDAVGLLVLSIVIALTCCELRYFRNEVTLNTFEGRFVRLLMWVTPLLLAGRTGYLYNSSELFTGFVLATAAWLGFIFLPMLTTRTPIQKVLQVASACAGAASWICFADVILRTISLKSSWSLPFVTLPIALLLLILSRYAIGGGVGYRRSAAVVALVGGTTNLLIFPGLSASFICMITATSILVYGYVAQQRILFFTGIAGVVFGLGHHLKFALNFYSLANWGSLAITGVAIIVLASVLERQQGQLKEKAQALRQRLQGWSN